MILKKLCRLHSFRNNFNNCCAANGVQIVVAQINKRYYNNNSDKYQQFTFDNDATYLINSSGELVKREKQSDFSD